MKKYTGTLKNYLNYYLITKSGRTHAQHVLNYTLKKHYNFFYLPKCANVESLTWFFYSANDRFTFQMAYDTNKKSLYMYFVLWL